MNRGWARWLPWTAIAVLFVLLLWHGWFGPDIWYHLYLGGRILGTGSFQPPDHLLIQQPGFVNFYWIFQLLVRGAFGLGGLAGVSLFFIAVWAVASGFWLLTTGALRAGAWGLLAALAAVLTCQTRFEERPEILSFAFLALQIHWLVTWRYDETPNLWKFLRFLLVQAAWSNVHGYFVFGPMLVGLRLASFLPELRAGKVGSGWISLLILFGLTLLASIASPFGLGNWREVALQADYLRRMHYLVQEQLPPTRVPGHLWSVAVFEGCWVAVAAASLILAASAARKELFSLMVAAVGLYLSSVSYRNIPLLVFFAAPLVRTVLQRLGRFPLPPRLAGAAVTVAGLGLSGWVVSDGYSRSLGGVSEFGIRAPNFAYPVLFSGYLRTQGFSGTIFNNPADGGYLEFHFPELRLYADTRLFETGPVRAYFAALSDPAHFRALRERQPFDAALLRVAESPAVVAAIIRDPGWRLDYAELNRAFFVDARRAPPAGAATRNPALYRGEDLSLPLNGSSAGAWIAIFARANDRRGLLSALGQFARSPKIPASVIKFALQWGRINSDSEVTAAAAALRPAMISSEAEARVVDELMGDAGAPGLPAG